VCPACVWGIEQALFNSTKGGDKANTPKFSYVFFFLENGQSKKNSRAVVKNSYFDFGLWGLIIRNVIIKIRSVTTHFLEIKFIIVPTCFGNIVRDI
jgi:hypothetical protein